MVTDGSDRADRARPGPRLARLLPRLRRRTRHALPDADVRPAPAGTRRRRQVVDRLLVRQPGAPVRHRGVRGVERPLRRRRRRLRARPARRRRSARRGTARGPCSSTGWRSWAAPRLPCSTRSTRSTRPATSPRRVVGGLGWEVASRLTADGVAFERPNTYGAGTGVTYDAEALKVLWERLAEDAGVELLLHTWATGVRLDDGRRLAAVRLWNKGGERWVEADAVRRRVRATRTSRAMAGASYEDATTTPGRRPVALDAVQARQRRRRSGVRGPQGRAVGPDARTRPRTAATGCRGSRGRGTGRRTRAW